MFENELLYARSRTLSSEAHCEKQAKYTKIQGETIGFCLRLMAGSQKSRFLQRPYGKDDEQQTTAE